MFMHLCSSVYSYWLKKEDSPLFSDMVVIKWDVLLYYAQWSETILGFYLSFGGVHLRPVLQSPHLRPVVYVGEH